MARRRAPLTDNAESPDIRAYRWHCSGANDIATGKTRWGTQLGLSLRLVASRHADATCAHERRLSGRSRKLDQLAVARGVRQSRANANHVRPGWRAASERARVAVAAGICQLSSGAHRQCRIYPITAG